jgi:hypothetical protein
MNHRPILVALVVLVVGSVAARSGEGRIERTTTFKGMCDASAVAPLDERHVAVADDEDNILRVYDLQTGGPPVWTLDVSSFLRVDPDEPEADLEGAARVGDRIYWITSHGRSRKGRMRPSRHRFFATEIVRQQNSAPALQPVGRPYSGLLAELLADPRFASFGLAAAAGKAPKDEGALNIEGLTPLPDGRLLIGFRNPQPFGRALFISLDNPDQVIAGARPRLGNPQLLDLDQRGVRGLGSHGNTVVIAAGAHDTEPRPFLYTWNPGSTATEPLALGSLADLTPESVEFLSDSRLVLVSDDGSVKIGKRECKKLKKPEQKQFRAVTAVL